jgi:hypothetical protein
MTAPHPHADTARSAAFPPASIDRLAAHYPETVTTIDHQLVGHPLLDLPELVALATRLPSESVEYNQGALPIGIAPEDVPSPALSAIDTIRSIEENGSWLVLKWIEQDPAYRALLDTILDEIVPTVEPVTGAMLTRQGFIFISSPDAVTPFHFDPEHNILLQIRGNKTMTLFPAADENIASQQYHEAYHLGGHRNLAWKEVFAAQGNAVALHPGQAVHVPVKMPHWVKNGSAVSISLSVTWRSEWSYAEADARAFNHMLRQFRLSPKAPGRFPAQNRFKSVGWRVMRKLGLTGRG